MIHLFAIVFAAFEPTPKCGNVVPDPIALEMLERIEEEAGVPDNRRGILAAIWCVESRWTPSGTALVGDAGRAVGPFQFHIPVMLPCLPPGYAGHDPRPELEFSARCWLKRVADLTPRAEALCGKRRAFDVAEALVSAPGRYAAKLCEAKTRHVKLLEVWQSRRAPPVVARD